MLSYTSFCQKNITYLCQESLNIFVSQNLIKHWTGKMYIILSCWPSAITLYNNAGLPRYNCDFFLAKKLVSEASNVGGQFHQHFTNAFFVRIQILQLFSNYWSALWFFSKRILAIQAQVKCWWNWPQVFNSFTKTFVIIFQISVAQPIRHMWRTKLFPNTLKL